jgi:hypothetical protein
MTVAGGPSFRMAGGCPASVHAQRRVLVGTGKDLLQLEDVEWNGKMAKGEAVVSLLKKEITRGFG